MIDTDNHFNSIKVQLRPIRHIAATGIATTFQFHKGTIKTLTVPQTGVGCSAFQFHKGTIKTAVGEE